MRKNIFVKLLIVAVFISTFNSLVSCSVGVSSRSVGVSSQRTTVVTKSKPLPPGQAKKVYGDKSAKNYTKKRR